MHQNPDCFLDELLHLLTTNHFVSIHYTTIHQELKHAGVSFKKLKRIAKERKEHQQANFIQRMAQYNPEELVFFDETSKDERTAGRCYGRSKKGMRASKKQVFIHGQCTSTTELLTIDGMVAGTVVEGSMTKEMFMVFLEFTVVCVS